MKLADISIGQELVYLSFWPQSRPGPRIRVTEKWDDVVIGIVLDAMGSVWAKDSELLCMPRHLYLPKDVPAVRAHLYGPQSPYGRERTTL